ncbi:MAG: TRAFs-binding domain-containing protein [Spirochaetia bacterium]|jgi:class 3 adenylate cyclase
MKEQNRDRFDSFLKRNRSRLGQVIHDLWDSRDKALWAKDPYFFLRLGERATTAGQQMFAHDVLREGLLVFPGHLLITQRYCLSLIKCGFLLTAKDLLTRLMKDGHFDEETLGILGSVYKEMWAIEGNGEPGHPYLAKSRELYMGAFRRSRGYYSGINAASLSLIIGDKELSAKTARQVLRICADRLKDPSQRDYWTMATVAEAFILLGRQERAAKFCRLARARSVRNYSNLASTRRQLSLLARYTKVDTVVLETLRIPPVIAFTGHMIDAPDLPHPHFPQSAARPVKQRIASLLKKLDARIGYASAACGADVLFHECLLARGGESNVILPFDKEDFFRTSVSFAGPEWKRRARAVLEKSSMVEQATRGGYQNGNEVLFSYANQLIMGKAILRSQFLETEPLLVAVWDGERNGRPGGTSECVRLWEQTGFPSIVINPATARVESRKGSAGEGKGAARRPAARSAARSATRKQDPRKSRQTVAILFADMVGYSKLPEEQVPAYVRGFLSGVSRTLQASAAEPLYRNTWGDAICLAFDDALQAAECAIALRDMVRTTDWSQLNLPGSLNVRIGLHAGPVYCVREPLLGRLNVFGFHVNQAARIEPITSPGNVYASESFAALLLTDPRNRLDCRYVGVIVLPKSFGSYPIYHIKRRTEVG